MAARVAVGVDGSPGSLRALAWAVQEAAGRDATLEAVMAWLPPGSGAGEGTRIAAEATDRLDRAVTEVLGPQPPVGLEKVVTAGEPASVLCQCSEEASVLVVGSRGRGWFGGARLGSPSARCAHHTRCPLVIVPGPDRRFRTSTGHLEPLVVVGVDRSEGSRWALEWGIDEARRRGWRTEVMEAWQEPFGGEMSIELDMPHFRRERHDLVGDARDRLERFVTDALGTDRSAGVALHLVDGDPALMLCARAARAALLVVGSRGQNSFARATLGSVSSSCARHSRGPIAIVPAPAQAPAPGPSGAGRP